MLALAKQAAVQGRTDDVVALLDTLEPSVTGCWIRLEALRRAFRTEAALEAAEKLVALLPDDRRALARLAELRNVENDPAGALAAADRLLEIDPEHPVGHYQRMLALRDLGKPYAEAEAAWLRHRRRTETDLRLRDTFRRRYPDRAHRLLPIGPD